MLGHRILNLTRARATQMVLSPGRNDWLGMNLQLPLDNASDYLKFRGFLPVLR